MGMGESLVACALNQQFEINDLFHLWIDLMQETDRMLETKYGKRVGNWKGVMDTVSEMRKTKSDKMKEVKKMIREAENSKYLQYRLSAELLKEQLETNAALRLLVAVLGEKRKKRHIKKKANSK